METQGEIHACMHAVLVSHAHLVMMRPVLASWHKLTSFSDVNLHHMKPNDARHVTITD